MKKPNIVLIMTDQMRGDCMGYAGHPDVKTPYLDSLGLKGAYFPNAYTACPSCIAARAGLMTGLSPEHHGRVGYADGVYWDYDCTLAGELAKNGYYTQCVGKMHVHPLRNNLGFHHVELHDGFIHYYRNVNRPLHSQQTYVDDYIYQLKDALGQEADIYNTGIDCNSWIARPWIYDEKYHPTNWVVSRSIDFLRRRDRTKPFFLTMSFVRPHPPFDAPQSFFDMYENMDLRPPVVGDWADNESYLDEGRFYAADKGIADPELQRRAQVGYYACISHIDNQIGRFLEALNMDGEADNTVIIFTSDHGELLGDHHTYRKIRPYQGSAHIPFLIKAPGHILPNPKSVYNSVVELRDIMPTLIDIAGGTIPDSLDGKSLLDVLSGKHDNLREYLHGEHSGGDIANHFIVTSSDKYIWMNKSGEEQYFDLENDPFELHNLIDSPKHQERIAYLRSLLVFELQGREEGYSENGKLIPGRQDKSVLSFLTQRVKQYDSQL